MLTLEKQLVLYNPMLYFNLGKSYHPGLITH